MFKLTLLTILTFVGTSTFALPEYAVRNNVKSCTACHYSQTGGGSRNVYGKLYGAHGYAINPLLVQDYVSADLRLLYYYPERPTDSKGGMGVMTGIIGGHVPIDNKLHIIAEHNVAGFAAAAYRDTYVQYRFNEYPKRSWLESLMVGRFRVPFGIVNDEHRTYTRILNATTFFDYEVGGMLSGTPGENWHYDVALVNGLKSNGSTISTGQATRFGTILNVRYMPGPFMFGASGSYHDRKPKIESRESASLYALWSVARMTDDRIPLSIQVEYERAWRWNEQLTRGFVNDPQGYGASIKTSAAEAWLGWATYTLTPHLRWCTSTTA